MRYDQATGVPTRIFADRMVRATDDEDTIEVSYSAGPAAPQFHDPWFRGGEPVMICA